MVGFIIGIIVGVSLVVCYRYSLKKDEYDYVEDPYL